MPRRPANGARTVLRSSVALAPATSAAVALRTERSLSSCSLASPRTLPIRPLRVVLPLVSGLVVFGAVTAFAASLSVAGLALTFAVLALLRAASRPLERFGPY